MANSTAGCLDSALQQPEWCDTSQVQRVRDFLASRPPLVRVEDVRALRSLLARVALGEALVVQAGDCAEDPEECTDQHVRRKSAVLDLLAGTLKIDTGLPVLRAGRIAGQFAKPRSRPTEQVGDLVLPVYRGHMVNGPEPTADDRRPDPLRILTCYMAAGDILEHLGWRDPAARSRSFLEPVVWTSHEALLLDYESPMIRELADGSRWLGTTHWPWIGERTRQVDGAHVRMLAEVVNPVACKVGPTSTAAEVLALCERLDPLREPGRLTLVARMGADLVTERLPALVEAVRAAGHPVIWLCDPLHANTITAPNGRKTRLVDTAQREVRGFREAVAAGGGVAGGLHLETTPDAVSECVTDASELDSAGEVYTSLCDPRLTPEQSVSVVSAWSAREIRTSVAKKAPAKPGLPLIKAYPLPEADALPENVATWEFDPARAVLLLHDMQTYFLKPLPEPMRTELVHNATLLRKRCADLGVQVAYTAQPGRMTPEQRGLLKDFWGEGMRATGDDREVVPELTPAPDDWVFTKWRYSALFKSELLQRMREAGRDQLVIAGVYGHIGIMTTALDAYSHDIEVFLVADAIGDFSQDLHRLTLDHVARSCGKVVTVGGVFA